MDKNQKRLRRGIRGIPSRAVQQLLSDREEIVQAAAEEARSAEERARASEARVAALEAQLAEAERTQDAHSRVTAAGADPRRLLQAVSEEMARVTHATQESGIRIIEHARTDADLALEDSERRHAEIEAEQEQLAGWIAQLQQSSPALRHSIVEVSGTLNRTIAAMNETEQAVVRMFGRMADTDAMIQRNQDPQAEVTVPDIAEEEGAVEAAMQPRPQAPRGTGNVLRTPAPPVDVSDRVPWALRTGPVADPR